MSARLTDRPIPIPLKQRLRQLRTSVLPLLVFAVAVIAVAVLWEEQNRPAVVVGEVYAPVAEMTVARAGLLDELLVEPFATVQAGQLLATVAVLPKDEVRASIEVLQAELVLLREGGADPVLDLQRNFLNWQGLRRDQLLARADLAALRVRVTEAGLVRQRTQTLFDRNITPQAELDAVLAEFDALSAELAERETLVAELDAAIQSARPLQMTGTSAETNAFERALDLQEKRIRLLEIELRPVEVRAPFAGVVTTIHRLPSEFLTLDTVLFSLQSAEPQYILGYLKMPNSLEPTLGMPVRVRRQHQPGVYAEAEILAVGAGYIPLPQSFVHPMSIREERALPIKISLPEHLPLLPGEILELQLPRS